MMSVTNFSEKKKIDAKNVFEMFLVGTNFNRNKQCLPKKVKNAATRCFSYTGNKLVEDNDDYSGVEESVVYSKLRIGE